MPTIRHSVLIEASVARVWDVLTTPRLIADWASTFVPGMYADSAWLPGCEVHWKNADGAVMLTGLVTEAKRGRILKVAFGHEQNPDAPKEGLEFTEHYELLPEDGGVRLSLECGPLRQQEFELLNGRWLTALEAVKRLAEAGGVAWTGAGRGAADQAPARRS